MHKCLKCGRTVSDITQIKDGCTCGSKVFVFSRSSEDDLPKEALVPKAAQRKSTLSFLPSISQAIDALSHVANPGTPSAPAQKESAPAQKSTIPASNEKIASVSSSALPSSSPAPVCAQEPAAAQRPARAQEPIPADEFGSLKPDTGPLLPSADSEPAQPVPARSTDFESPVQVQDRASLLTPAQAKLVEPSDPVPARSSPITAEQAKPTPDVLPSAVASSFISDEEEPAEPGTDYKEVWLAKGGRIDVAGADPKEGDSGIENVRQLSRGVFEVDLSALDSGPLVVRDQEGVYYVRLPFEQPAPKPKKK